MTACSSASMVIGKDSFDLSFKDGKFHIHANGEHVVSFGECSADNKWFFAGNVAVTTGHEVELWIRRRGGDYLDGNTLDIVRDWAKDFAVRGPAGAFLKEDK